VKLEELVFEFIEPLRAFAESCTAKPLFLQSSLYLRTGARVAVHSERSMEIRIPEVREFETDT